MITNEGAFMKNKISDKDMFQNFEVKAYWFLNDNQNFGSYGFFKIAFKNFNGSPHFLPICF